MTTADPQSGYLLAGQASELDRLRLQSRVWEPAGRALLGEIPRCPGVLLDVGCGVMGWLRVLAQWAGNGARVLGTDVDDKMLANARAFIDEERLANASVQKDDLFASKLPHASFDLVHARFQIAPLGRAEEQLAVYRRVLRPGGWLVLEEGEFGSWRLNPDAPASSELMALIERGFAAAGGELNAGRRLPAYLESIGIAPQVRAHVVALNPGHPYLRLPIQFATALRPRLTSLLDAAALDALIARAEEEVARPGTWGTTFTLVQAFGRKDIA